MRVHGGVEPRSLGAPILLPVGSPPSDLGGGAGLSHTEYDLGPAGDQSKRMELRAGVGGTLTASSFSLHSIACCHLQLVTLLRVS